MSADPTLRVREVNHSPLTHSSNVVGEVVRGACLTEATALAFWVAVAR